MRRAAIATMMTLAACAPSLGDVYPPKFAAGERAFRAGRYEEAAQLYDDAAASALRVKDRDEALFMEARCDERAERWTDATRTYDRLIAVSPKGPRSERAVYDLAEIAIAHGDADKGWAALEKAILAAPNHGLARPSILRMLDHLRSTGGDDAALAWLAKMTPLLEKTDQAQTVEYERAMALDRQGKKDEAHDAFVATAMKHPYPLGGLTDDALFRAAQIDEDRGRFDEAIAHLRLLLSSREASQTVGSYERPRYSPAQMEIALIYRDKLHDHASARRELHKLYTDHTTSTLRAVALWDEAILAKEDGDKSAACTLTETIAKDLPDSRYASCGKLLCDGAPEPKKPCHDYIARDLDAAKP